MLNVVVLIGRLVADPELRHTSTDIPVTSFRLAVDRGYVKAGAERQADFIDIVCWRNQAEFASKYFHKGMMVAIEGSLQSRNFEDKNGNKRTAYEVVATSVHFAEPRRDSGSQSSPAYDTSRMAPPSISAGDNGDFVEIDGDEDLPF